MMLTTRLKNTSYKVLAALYNHPQQWCFITASTLFDKILIYNDNLALFIWN